MTIEEKKEIGVALMLTAKLYNTELESDVARMIVEDLSDLQFWDVHEALGIYRKNPKNRSWPRAADIRAIIFPVESDETKAREASARIIQAISKFGWPNPVNAEKFIGEAGWSAVLRFGGWKYICENMGTTLSPGTFLAQARDLCQAHFEQCRVGSYNKPVSLPEQKTNHGLESAGQIMKSLANQQEQSE